MKENKKHKHLSREDRLTIQDGLYRGKTFKEIGEKLGKDPSTVAKEVRAHTQKHVSGFSKMTEPCPKLSKAPHVCNGCPLRSCSSCKYVRMVYNASKAQEEYETLLKESRECIALNKEEFYATEKILSEAIKNGQHVYQAICAHSLNISKSTAYRYIRLGYCSARSIDLPRAVKFRARAKKSPSVPHAVKQGRTYQDYLVFREAFPQLPTVEMDTVIGRPGGKVIMTFLFVDPGFMFGLLLDNRSAPEAADKIIELKRKLYASSLISFAELFPVMLTDNGGEFSNVAAFENDFSGSRESLVFFCDPNAPFQKPHVENNHILFRDIVPKGSSFDDFTQETVNLIFSHVNSVSRKQFGGKSAYDMFTFMYSPEIAALLGISHIPPESVVQSPLLLK